LTSFWMDCGWRTGVLGTCYYGYRTELTKLRALLKSRALTIVTGPKGSGKTEFLRYFLENYVGKGYVLIDPTETAERGGVGRASSLVSLRKRLMEAAESAVSVFKAVRVAGEALLDAARHAKGYIVLAVDTIPGGTSEDMQELVTMASMLTNNPKLSGRVKAVVAADSRTVSYGLADTLSHLSVGWLTLNGLDEASMAALMNEYLMGGGRCGLGVDAFIERVGGLPAYLTSGACYEPEEWFVEREHYFRSVVAKISAESGVGYEKVLRTVCRVLRAEGAEALGDALSWVVADELVRAGVAYRVMPGSGVIRPTVRYYGLVCGAHSST